MILKTIFIYTFLFLGTAKNKKKSLVDELMADAEFQRYNKRKYTEIIADKAKQMNKRDQKKFAKKSKLK